MILDFMNQIYVLILSPSEDIFLRPRTYGETITKTNFSVWLCLTQTVKICLILWAEPQNGIILLSLLCPGNALRMEEVSAFSSAVLTFKCFKIMMRLVIFLCHMYSKHMHTLKALCELLHKLSSLQCPSERESDVLCNSMRAFYPQLSHESTT